MSSKKLRNIERLVLSRLELDSRMPFSKVGKGIRKSQQHVSYTVNSMIEKGIIQNFYTLIDYSKLDVLNFRVYFRVNYISDKKFMELIDYLVSQDHTAWVATRGGRYDIICTFFASNPSKFNKIWKGIIEKFPDRIQDYMILTSIVNLDFGRKYLLKDNLSFPRRIAGGDREPMDIDDTDMKILKEISENARINSVTLGHRLSLTPKTVIDRIKKLKKRKIILGFKPLVMARNMGYISYLLFIKYHNISSEMEQEFLNYLKTHPNVTRAVKTIGEWDIEIHVEMEDSAELRKSEMEMRERFTTLIKEIASVPLYKTYKKTFFPGFLINE